MKTMPKNIYSIKENYKKVEEVREIENETPSFEEFMENYEFDERVINSYKDEVNHVNVWVPKGSGPCRWSNPSCSCQYGERWIDLRIPCPVSGCGNTSVINQTHSCGGQAEISNKARIQCRSCGVVSHMRNWNFSCSNHSSYQTAQSGTSSERWIHIITIAGRTWNNDDLVTDLLVYLMNNRW
jgi:hypothetical protein